MSPTWYKKPLADLFGPNLRKRREFPLLYTVEEFAWIIDVDPQFVRDLESGAIVPDLNVVDLCAYGLEDHPTHLLMDFREGPPDIPNAKRLAKLQQNKAERLEKWRQRKGEAPKAAPPAIEQPKTKPKAKRVQKA
jgi:hypothetical protein